MIGRQCHLTLYMEKILKLNLVQGQIKKKYLLKIQKMVGSRLLIISGQLQLL